MQELNFENIKKNWQNSNHNFNFEKAIKKQKLETYKNLISICLSSLFMSALICLLTFFLCKDKWNISFSETTLYFSLSFIMWTLFLYYLFRYFIYFPKNQKTKNSSLDLINFQIKKNNKKLKSKKKIIKQALLSCIPSTLFILFYPQFFVLFYPQFDPSQVFLYSQGKILLGIYLCGFISNIISLKFIYPKVQKKALNELTYLKKIKHDLTC